MYIGNFSGNYAESATSAAYGGAIYINSGQIGNITGDFTNNHAKGSVQSYGGAIMNAGLVGYNEMLSQIEPSAIICFGKPFDEMTGNIIVVDYISSRSKKRGA